LSDNRATASRALQSNYQQRAQRDQEYLGLIAEGFSSMAVFIANEVAFKTTSTFCQMTKTSKITFANLP